MFQTLNTQSYHVTLAETIEKEPFVLKNYYMWLTLIFSMAPHGQQMAIIHLHLHHHLLQPSNPEGQGEALPASDRETCTRGSEGLVTQAARVSVR